MIDNPSAPNLTIDTVRRDVDAVLDGFFADRLDAAGRLDAAYKVLWESMSRLTRAGGKRLRPYLTVLAYQSYGGGDYQGILRIAAAYELLHQALLVHDDIVDKDYVRYGVANVAGQYRQLYAQAGSPPQETDHFANAAALTAGDLALSAAHTMIFDSSLPLEQQVVALRSLARSTFEVAAGQLLDMESALDGSGRTEGADTPDALKIARLKTASYSFVGPLTCGAMLGGAPEADVRALESIGYDLGVAYQLADDLLGVFGDEQATGKSTISDLREGKRTYLIQETLRRASVEDRVTVERYLGDPDLTVEQAGMIRAIIDGAGAKGASEVLAGKHARQAGQKVADLRIASGDKQRLLAFIGTVVQRER